MRGAAGDSPSMVSIPASASLNVSLHSIHCTEHIARDQRAPVARRAISRGFADCVKRHALSVRPNGKKWSQWRLRAPSPHQFTVLDACLRVLLNIPKKGYSRLIGGKQSDCVLASDIGPIEELDPVKMLQQAFQMNLSKRNGTSVGRARCYINNRASSVTF